MRKHAAAVVLLSIALGSSAARAQSGLSGYQQTIHDEVTAAFDRAEQRIAEAREKLAAGDARAAASALNAATRDYNAQSRRLVQLPADHAATAKLKSRGDAIAGALREAGDAVKAGAAAPAKPAAEKPAAADAKPEGPARLDYQQVDTLKGARFNLAEVESRAKRYFEIADGAIDAEAVAEAKELGAFIAQRMGYAVGKLNGLPGDHPDVAAETARFNKLREQLIAAQDKIAKAAPAAAEAATARQAAMADDLAMVQSWSESLRSPPNLFVERPDDAIAVIGQLPEMRSKLDEMLARWTERAEAKPNDREAEAAVRRLRFVDGQLTEFASYRDALAAALPGEIANDLAEANRLIDAGVSQRKPAYFGADSGIAQQLGFAEGRVKLLTAMDADAAKKASASLDAARQKARDAEQALAKDIIDNNKRPAERYRGDDLDALRERVAARWKELHPELEIVAIIFSQDGWSRTTRWDWSKGTQSFGKVDYDHMQPKLFYKLDESRAVEVPVEVYKDYMKNERLAIRPWEVEATPPVTRTYLLKNLK